jgi:dihydroorotase
MIYRNILLDGERTDILVRDGIIKKIGCNGENDEVIDCTGLVALPAFVDLHVHLREPGFEHKETVYTGTLAARNGGFSDVFCMPNTKPVCDSIETVKYILNRQANVKVHPIGAVTRGQKCEEICDFGAYSEAGVLAVSDDGMPVPNDDILEKAMLSAKKYGLLFICHCENKSVIKDRLNIPSEAEYSDVIRVLGTALKTGAKVHIAHVSTKESISAIRDAKRSGADVTAETCPHYFTLTSDAVELFGANAMMNPPLRFEEDVYAVTEALTDGTVDMISTDHAPHSEEEKSVEKSRAPFGITGLETSFPLSYTNLVKKGIITLEALLRLMSEAPAKRAGTAINRIEEGKPANFIAADLSSQFVFRKEKSLSKSKNTPFDGTEMTGRAVYNILEGELFRCQPIF